ncbi:DgyrCDS7596 [Dimorphilus gyrociliatus]|uniref:Pyridoxine-5'-phosphate oxidase n=1 Tax=Dimorphilus gyrociliatus TaxID=2664684 RepID=A0A7I8VRI2_9ANNE|nr:DgyrCDS7596 [Dimorphilus gyrociliatus]
MRFNKRFGIECCGANTFNISLEVCCNGNIYKPAFAKDLMNIKCCNGRIPFDLRVANCKNGIVVETAPLCGSNRIYRKMKCCGSQFGYYEQYFTCLHRGNSTFSIEPKRERGFLIVKIKKLTESKHNATIFISVKCLNSSKKRNRIMKRGITYITLSFLLSFGLSTNKCNGGDDSGIICCNGIPYRKYQGPTNTLIYDQCCVSKPYLSEKQICCKVLNARNQVVYKLHKIKTLANITRTPEFCCGLNKFNMNYQRCDSGKTLWKNEQLCNGVIYDINNELCCNGMRKPYGTGAESFDIRDLHAKEPIGQFMNWFQKAVDSSSNYEANAMSLATTTSDGKPSVRIVLMKAFDERGLQFFTNFNSRKAKELIENPHASVVFHWIHRADNNKLWSRQVRMEGIVEKVSSPEADAYFSSRPKDSQIATHISIEQSAAVANREEMLKTKEELYAKFDNEAVPRPYYWGGFLIKPHTIEFWQGQTNRLHDRIVFKKMKPEDVPDKEPFIQGENGWIIQRLIP